MGLKWCSAAQTHCGKRRTRNEDAVLSRPDAGLWAVADGMGGHLSGELASRAVAEALDSLSIDGSLADVVDAVDDALVEVNHALRSHAQSHGEGHVVGTTVVALVVRERVGVALWAGDSRLYRLRGARLEQVTRDHNPIADLLDSGAVSEADALAADTNIITRAVGAQPELFLDVAVFDIHPGDTFLLCSDGLYRELTASELAHELGRDAVDEIGRDLLQKCLATAARDNVSLVLARAERP